MRPLGVSYKGGWGTQDKFVGGTLRIHTEGQNEFRRWDTGPYIVTGVNFEVDTEEKRTHWHAYGHTD
jgi:hypothetical protein